MNKVTKELVEKMIKNNYPVLLGFEVAEGKLSFEEYFKKLKDYYSTEK